MMVSSLAAEGITSSGREAAEGELRAPVPSVVSSILPVSITLMAASAIPSGALAACDNSLPDGRALAAANEETTAWTTTKSKAASIRSPVLLA